MSTSSKPASLRESYHSRAYDFVESIVSGRAPLVTLEDVFQSMSVCFAIEQARDQGGAVEVEYL